MKFTVQITAPSRTARGYGPQIPVLPILSPKLNLLNTPHKIPRYATVQPCLQRKNLVEICDRNTLQ